MNVLALHPQAGTLHVGVGAGDACRKMAFTLITDWNGLIEREIAPWLSGLGLDNSLQSIVTSGFLPKADEDGIYLLSPQLAQACTAGGAALAKGLADTLGLPAYLIDPTIPQQCHPHALITGTPLFTRRCDADSFIFKYLSRQEGPGNFIIAHLDETVQIGALTDDRLLDLDTSAAGGPFAFSQAGQLPFDGVLDLCEQAESCEELLERLGSAGGFRGYLGVPDFAALVMGEMPPKDTRVEQIWQAFIYQVAKEIGALAAVLKGQIDAILLTGELVKNEAFVAALSERIRFLGRISPYPGNQGLNALLAGAERISAGEPIIEYNEKGESPWDLRA